MRIPITPASATATTFITGSTFGLRIFRWPTQAVLFADIDAWWRANAEQGRASVLPCYSFGKAQRILQGVDASIGPCRRLPYCCRREARVRRVVCGPKLEAVQVPA
jgi:Cft2 family RNA processing exonuclease